MPSAGRPFTPELVTELVSRGVLFAPVTLHTGVSSLEHGEAPFPERFRVPAATARLVNAVRGWGGRVIAVGTTVVRALETVAARTAPCPRAAGWTSLVVTPERGLLAIDGLLTGWHEPESSHLAAARGGGRPRAPRRSYRAALERRLPLARVRRPAPDPALTSCIGRALPNPDSAATIPGHPATARKGGPMATKADFTEEEWKMLQKGVTGAGLLVSGGRPRLHRQLRRGHRARKVPRFAT